MSRAYADALDVLLRESGCTVRRWRKRNSGMAYTTESDWGIEIPPARGPLSFAVGAHEIAHQLFHRGGRRAPRWLGELECEEFALAQFDRFGLEGVDRVRENVAKHLRYAAAKSVRRGGRADVILERYPEWVWGEDGRYADDLVRLAEQWLDRRAEILQQREEVMFG